MVVEGNLQLPIDARKCVNHKVRGATAFRAERRVLCGDFVERRRAVGYTARQ